MPLGGKVMKKEWSNPELKDLELDKTNEEVTCTAEKETREGIHIPGGCKYGLGFNALNCPHIIKWTLICTYKETTQPIS